MATDIPKALADKRVFQILASLFVLLGLVLASLLVAQAGHSGVVHISDLGLAIRAPTEAAEGLGGGVEMRGGILNLDVIVTAGGADHLANLAIPETVTSSIRGDDLTSFIEAPPRSADIVHGRVVEVIVRVTHGVEQIRKRGKEVFRGSKEADIGLGLSRVQGGFLSRDIPPVPGPLGSGRGERSLEGEDQIPIMGGPASRQVSPAVHLVFFGGVDARINPSVETRLKGVSVDPILGRIVLHSCESAVCLGGVDVFHGRTIALPLAHVKQSVKITDILPA